MSTINANMRYRCPYCAGVLTRAVVGHETGCHEEIIVCVGRCKRQFLPSWHEHQWAEPESRPIPAELATAISFDPAALSFR